MVFNLKYQLGGRLLLVIFGGFILLISGTIALSIWLNLGENMIALSVLVGFPAILYTAIKTSYKVTVVKIDGDKISVNKLDFNFSYIKYYFIRNETPKIVVLDLGLSSGEEISITGINHGKLGDEIGKFVSFMQQRFNETPQVALTESKAAIKFKKLKQRGKRFIKDFIYFYLLFDVFILIMYLSGWKDFPFLSLLAGNLILPMIAKYAFSNE